jgi:hypothetical protein
MRAHSTACQDGGNTGPTLMKGSISLWHGHVIPHYAWAGPAYNSRQLDKGDLVVEIDGQGVGDNLTKLLVGSDVAGTPVTLTVKKGGNTGPKKSVTLLRMPSEAIADRRRLFELFTAMKARSTLPRGKETIEGMIDNAIELWTRMTIADGEREAKVRKKVSGAQDVAKKLFVKLKDAADTKKGLYFERHDDALGFRDSVDAFIQDLQHAQLEHARVILNLKVCCASATEYLANPAPCCQPCMLITFSSVSSFEKEVWVGCTNYVVC